MTKYIFTNRVQFQSTRPRGTRLQYLMLAYPMLFQSTRPRGTRRGSRRGRQGLPRFNPRVREGRDCAASVDFPMPSVSIHASARDATSLTFDITGKGRVSIHASARDATPSGQRALPWAGFNPRVREGRDLLSAAGLPSVFVSIHASARDATPAWRARGGLFMFQSTRPRGTRPYRQGCRPGCRVSIHASARDATRYRQRCARKSRVSIHASARDATTLDLLGLLPRTFQSTRPRGTRLILFFDVAFRQRFNPRVREGRDVNRFRLA